LEVDTTVKDKILILVAGAPGTGKTYSVNIIRQAFPALRTLTLDRFKEDIWDEIGFDDIEQKKSLNKEAQLRFIRAMRRLMIWEKPIISDYPFSDKQRDDIEKSADDYGYHIVTVRLEAPDQVLYERQRHRDLFDHRHPGHLQNAYHLEDQAKGTAKLDGMPTFEQFQKRLRKRKYDKFYIGDLLKVDVSDFQQVNYQRIVEQLSESIKQVERT
jgi:predicted kinase